MAEVRTKPVFTDESGRRLSLFQWLARGLCAGFVLITGAVVFTLLTQVPLPGLGGLLPDRTEAPTPRSPADTGGDRAVADSTRPSVPAAEVTTSRVDPVVADRAVRTGQKNSTVATGASVGGDQAASETTATPAAATPAPSANANPQATTKVRNPQAAPKQAAPTPAREPNAHAATGLAKGKSADGTVDSSTPPGQSKP